VEESYRSYVIPHKLKFLGTRFNGTRSGDSYALVISVTVAPFLCLLGYIFHCLVAEKLCAVSSIWNSLSKLFEILLLFFVIVSYLVFTTSFQVEEFAANPRVATLLSLKKTELVMLATQSL